MPEWLQASLVRGTALALAITFSPTAAASEASLECPRKAATPGKVSMTREEQTSMAQALKEAIARGDKKGTCSALLAGADPSLPVLPTSKATSAGWAKTKSPAVVLAAGTDDPWFLTTLLAHGANPNAECDGPGREYCYPFVMALLSVNDSHVQLLLDGGLNVHVRDAKGRGLLRTAIGCGAYGVARALLKAGARLEDDVDDVTEFFRLLAVIPNLSPEQQSNRDAFIGQLRSMGYKFDLSAGRGVK